MALEHYIRSGQRLLRCGYTTGTCAALAAAAACTLLLRGEAPEAVELTTPGGVRVAVAPEWCRMEGTAARCAVRKDAGDDPDVTDGMLICADVTRTERGIAIDGGAGIGRVTKPGLDQPVGAAAINRVPRRMIAAAVENVCAETGYAGGVQVTIWAPEGAARAEKTFNPALGIEGGISILGTSGIVAPMSEQAIVDTIALEARQAALRGGGRLVLSPGNYGADFLRAHLDPAGEIPCVKYANFLGEAIDIAALEGFGEVLVVGHIGKLVKLAGGIMNTHSHMADCRRELFCAHAALQGAGREVCRALMDQATTDGCIAVLDGVGLREAVLESLLEAMQAHLDRRGGGALALGAVTFSNEYGLLGMTPRAREIWTRWRAEA
jgi:cobalt-precorrin-5B (C1)-methyltransferase